MTNKEKCKVLLSEYREISGEKLQHAFNERNYGDHEKGSDMVKGLKNRLAEIENEILELVSDEVSPMTIDEIFRRYS